MRRGIVGVCKWGCGRPVAKPALYWHPECFRTYALHTRPADQKEFLIERDGRRCALCRAAPMRWLARPVIRITSRNVWRGARDEEWAKVFWDDPEKRWLDMSEEERDTGAHQEIERVCALEVDHRVPLWSVAHLPDDQRRAFFGPDNLWLLCPADHKAKSKREAAERAAVRKVTA